MYIQHSFTLFFSACMRLFGNEIRQLWLNPRPQAGLVIPFKYSSLEIHSVGESIEDRGVVIRGRNGQADVCQTCGDNCKHLRIFQDDHGLIFNEDEDEEDVPNDEQPSQPLKPFLYQRRIPLLTAHQPALGDGIVRPEVRICSCQGDCGCGAVCHCCHSYWSHYVTWNGRFIIITSPPLA